MSLQLHTLETCRLVIGGYPPFRYDARGGGGTARVTAGPGPDLQTLAFDAGELHIPPLNRRHGRFLGLPLPPGLEIRITPEALSGQLESSSGHLTLRFQARFQLRIGRRYRAPDLVIDTQLVSGAVRGQRHRAQGRPRDHTGAAVLVGVAPVQPCGEPWLDGFLGLPDEALAVLHCRLVPG